MAGFSLQTPFFHPRRRSLARGNLLVVISLAVSLRMSDFPNNRPDLWLILPAVGVILGTFDTVRCMRTHWSFYHGGVLLCIYMDLMAITIILFSLIYPYIYVFTGAR